MNDDPPHQPSIPFSVRHSIMYLPGTVQYSSVCPPVDHLPAGDTVVTALPSSVRYCTVLYAPLHYSPISLFHREPKDGHKTRFFCLCDPNPPFLPHSVKKLCHRGNSPRPSGAIPLCVDPLFLLLLLLLLWLWHICKRSEARGYIFVVFEEYWFRRNFLFFLFYNNRNASTRRRIERHCLPFLGRVSRVTSRSRR